MKLFVVAAALAALIVCNPAAAQFAEGQSQGQAVVAPNPGVTATNAPRVYNPKPDGPLGALAVAPQQGGTIDIGQAFNAALAPYINAAMSALVYAAMGWLFYLLQKKFNINIDAGHREAITQAAQRQASSLVADGMVSLQGKTVHVDSAALADAVNHLTAAAPGAIAHFGITPQSLADRIVDMVPQVPAIAPVVAKAAAEPAAPPSQIQPEKPA